VADRAGRGRHRRGLVALEAVAYLEAGDEPANLTTQSPRQAWGSNFVSRAADDVPNPAVIDVHQNEHRGYEIAEDFAARFKPRYRLSPTLTFRANHTVTLLDRALPIDATGFAEIGFGLSDPTRHLLDGRFRECEVWFFFRNREKAVGVERQVAAATFKIDEGRNKFGMVLWIAADDSSSGANAAFPPASNGSARARFAIRAIMDG
jgi:hypothetical protein